MTAIEELIREVQAAGVILTADPPDLVVKPAERLTPALESRLKENKAEVLYLLQLRASMRRLEAARIAIAAWDDGTMRVIQSEEESIDARRKGGTVYSPADLYYYVRLEPHERRMLHEFKKRFGGTTEWKP